MTVMSQRRSEPFGGHSAQILLDNFSLPHLDGVFDKKAKNKDVELK